MQKDYSDVFSPNIYVTKNFIYSLNTFLTVFNKNHRPAQSNTSN